MNFISKKTHVTIATLVAGISVIAMIWGLQRADILRLSTDGGANVVFKLIDGDTDQPISNVKVTICDDAIIFDRVAKTGETYQGICSEQKVWEHVTTNHEGKFSLNIKRIGVTPPTDIIFELSNDFRYSTAVSRSDTLTNHYSPSHLRVINAETPYHLVSNLLYNLDTKEVKEIPITGDPETTSTFEIINLKVFKNS